jgi:hypothetical protein
MKNLRGSSGNLAPHPGEESACGEELKWESANYIVGSDANVTEGDRFVFAEGAPQITFDSPPWCVLPSEQRTTIKP